jgi:hypothetical protein
VSLFGKFPVFVICLFEVSNIYEEFEEAPSFLPPNTKISVFEIGHDPNQYLISFSKLGEYTLISSQN